jgi:hypothetical protein
MPPGYSMEGIEAANAIREERPETGVVMLTQHDDEGYVWALLERGVAGYGYLHKVRVGEVDQLVRAIFEVVPLEIRIWPVTCKSLGCQAAREYSLIRPPRTGFRWIRSPSRSATGRRPPSCSPQGTRWAMPWCGRAVL